jgi:hypothetical protein
MKVLLLAAGKTRGKKGRAKITRKVKNMSKRIIRNSPRRSFLSSCLIVVRAEKTPSAQHKRYY